MNISAILKGAETVLTQNSPHILTGIGASGVLVTSILATKAAYQAGAEDYYASGFDNFDTSDKIERHWRKFIPAAVAGTITVTAIIAANRVGTRRTAAIATAYAISERAYSEYREKVAEKLTKPKYQEIDDEIAAGRVQNGPDKEVVIVSGEHLCYDMFSDRYFKGDIEALKHAQNKFERDILHDGYASLSNYYEHIGLQSTEYSDSVGWKSDDPFDIDYGSHLGPDGRPCITIRFTKLPSTGYYKYG